VLKWLGAQSYSTFYPDCFPGNIVRAIYLAEKKAASATGSPMVEAEHGQYDSFLANMLKPYI